MLSLGNRLLRIEIYYVQWTLFMSLDFLFHVAEVLPDVSFFLLFLPDIQSIIQVLASMLFGPASLS